MTERGFRTNVDTLDDYAGDGVISCISAVMDITCESNNDLIRCPHCGESYYMYLFSERTLAYYPTIYKDGVPIHNEDKNKTTNHYECMNCHKGFSSNDLH